MKPSDPHSHNRSAWDRLAAKQDRLAKPAQDKDFHDPLRGLDSRGWLGDDISGQHLLCLAAGGGRQGPIYAAAGAIVTVVDISPAMLELDRAVAAERGLNLRTIEASMDDLASLTAGEFDVVINPVSTCYVPDLEPVYREVARVLKPAGLFISQHKQPTSMQACVQPVNGKYEIKFPYYLPTPLPVNKEQNLVRENGTLEYIHRWESLLGTMCRAGFVIEDISEPLHAKQDANPGSFAHRSQFIPAYVRVKARRTGSSKDTTKLIV